MSKIFKPRRGKASTMLGTKASTVLAAGEMFIELPDTGVGTGICKMKMGDGVTAYSSLPYAMGGDIASTEITGSIVEDTSATAAAALANVTTGRTLGAIVGSLRRACQLNAQSIATLNDDIRYISRTVQVDTITNNNLHTYIEIPVWAHQIVLSLAGDNNTTRFSTLFPLTQFALNKTQQVNGYISNERVFFTVKYIDLSLFSLNYTLGFKN